MTSAPDVDFVGRACTCRGDSFPCPVAPFGSMASGCQTGLTTLDSTTFVLVLTHLQEQFHPEQRCDIPYRVVVHKARAPAAGHRIAMTLKTVVLAVVSPLLRPADSQRKAGLPATKTISVRRGESEITADSADAPGSPLVAGCTVIPAS